MTADMEVTAGGVRWRIAPQLREQLLGDAGLRLDDWLRHGQARIVKHARHRTVYNVCLTGLHFYLKHNRAPDAKSRLVSWVRPVKALIEYRHAQAIAARDVPTIEPLAVGVAEQAGDSWLLTRALEDVCQLDSFIERRLTALPEPARTWIRQRLAMALGRLLARMHDAGVVHCDLHPGNFLLHLDGTGGFHLHLVDLQEIALGAPLDWHASRDNIVMLNRWFSLRVSRSDRLRAWHAYCAARMKGKVKRCACPGRIREIENLTLESNLAFWRSRDPRCREDNRRFRRVSSSAARGHAVADFDEQILQSLLADPDAPFRQPGVKLLKDSASSTVAEIEVPMGETMEKAIWKRFNVGSWLDPLVNLVRPSGALRSWTLGHGLRLRWLPTPRPLLVLHRRRGGLSYEGYLLTAKIWDAEVLWDFMGRMAEQPCVKRRQELLPLLEDVARLVRGLHQCRISHRDLKASNLLVVGNPSSQKQASSADPIDHWPLTSSRVWFIDLVGMRLHRRLGEKRKVKNLARLNASFLGHPALTNADRLRFLLLYLGNSTSWKSWWKRIVCATSAKVERNRRSGRILR